MPNKLYLGLMSGTSLDGVSAAVVDLTQDVIDCKASATYAFPNTLRDRLLKLAQPNWRGSLLEIQELDLEVGRFYVECSNKLLAENNLSESDLHAVGAHGQTICHTPNGSHPSSWQIGDPNVIAEALGTTVADWRRRDMAAGGQGAPLTPGFHQFILGKEQDAAVINFGGIANLTVYGKAWLGFDTGPANILLDAWIQKHKQVNYDARGDWARSGKINEALLQELISDDYFSSAPPKSTGREYFNIEWLEQRLQNTAPIKDVDVQTTLVELTTKTAIEALQKYSPMTTKLYVCGGGIHNEYLMERLRSYGDSQANSIAIDSTEKLGVDPDYVEAIAFAWLAKNTLDGKTGNVTGATGACGERVIGAIYNA